MSTTVTVPAHWIEIAAAGIHEPTGRTWSAAPESERQRYRTDAQRAIEALLRAMPIPSAPQATVTNRIRQLEPRR